MSGVFRDLVFAVERIRSGHELADVATALEQEWKRRINEEWGKFVDSGGRADFLVYELVTLIDSLRYGISSRFFPQYWYDTGACYWDAKGNFQFVNFTARQDAEWGCI